MGEKKAASNSSAQRANGSANGSANGVSHAKIVTAIPEVPVTVERPLFMQKDENQSLSHTGTARANIAATAEHPEGSTDKGWASRHKDKTVLQQHLEFFDRDADGVIWPSDTFVGFYRLGFGVILSIVAIFIIHPAFSYPTLSGWVPDPFLRIYATNIHKDKHGSDSGAYDNEGRFLPQKFEDIFAKYGNGKDSLNLGDITRLLKGQRLILDPVGWGGTAFEWFSTYYMVWPEDGELKKEDVRQVFDGSLFYNIAAKRQNRIDAAHSKEGIKTH